MQVQRIRNRLNNPFSRPVIDVGTHLALLIQVITKTTGPVLELGTGLYSTPFLHWACAPYGRPLFSYENDPRFFPFASAYQTETHHVGLVEDWDAIDLSGPWTVAFIDHAPAQRRVVDIRRLTHAEFLVAHDTTALRNKHTHAYNYRSIRRLFKYKFERIDNGYGTTVFSNFHDVSTMFR